jgi:predicted nucleotidyltransferase
VAVCGPGRWYVYLPYGKYFYQLGVEAHVTLHDYAAEILGSKTSIRLLRTLARYKGRVFTIRELSAAAGVSHPQASTVLKELERRGVVRLQPVGKAYQVTLNHESYIVKSVIEPLFAAEKNTEGSLISAIAPFFDDPRIISAAIFGSVARGDEGTDSDVDLLIISDDTEFANECAARAVVTTLSRFGHALSPLILDRKKFLRDQERDLEKSILERYMLVRGRDLREMVKNGKAGR